jgi:hypothetical protein
MERRRQIRLPASMDAFLVALAAERGVTVSQLVREAVDLAYWRPQIWTTIPYPYWTAVPGPARAGEENATPPG